MTVAYQGAEGAFSHEACLRLVPGHEPIAFESFEEVVEAVRTGEADLGVLPVSNNEAGETGAAALIGTARLRVVAEAVLPVRMHLLGLPDTKLEQVRTVASHPVALRQCAANLEALGVATEVASNTAVAAKALRDPARAVLASEAAARLYGLQMIRRDLQDRPDNATRFAVIERAES